MPKIDSERRETRLLKIVIENLEPAFAGEVFNWWL